jgi:hypothetical protein
LTSFQTNYSVKSGVLNLINHKAQQLENVVFDSNEFFSPNEIENFRSKMKNLSHFGFFINVKIWTFAFSYDKNQLCARFHGCGAVHRYTNSDITLIQQYLALFSIPVQCQTVVQYINIPISAQMLKSLTYYNAQLKQLKIDSCNIPPVIDSLREVFQKCKQLVRFEYSDFYNLMTAEHLQSLFSETTTLKVIIFDCNPSLTSKSLELMVQNSPLLTELRLYNTKGSDLTTFNIYMKNVKSNVKFNL